MALKLRKSKRSALPPVSVNITSVMDVMVVLLFFLIKSFSVASMSSAPPKGIRLPTSDSVSQVEEGVTIAVQANRITINGTEVAKLSQGRVLASDLGDDQRTLLPLKKFLDRQSGRRKELYSEVTDHSLLPQGKVLIQADKQAKFSTLKYIFHTAAAASYGDFQLAVETKD